MESLLDIKKRLSSQLKEVVLAALISVIWVVWAARNSCRFNNKNITLQSAKVMVASAVCFSGKLSRGTMYNTMEEFTILKEFSIDGHPTKAPKIKEVIWLSPPPYWTKCNIDRAAHGCPGPSACGGIFRGFNAAALGCFSCHLGVSTSLNAELSAAMHTIEIASSRGWVNLWIETDSAFVVRAFNYLDTIPWRLQTRWKNCMETATSFNLQVTHIFGEGNSCADKLANHGIHHPGFHWWDTIPSFVSEDFIRNRQGSPFFRFS